MSQHQEKATIIKFEQLSGENIRLTLHAPLIAESAKPGQFVMIHTGVGRDPLLRRPFSLHQASSNGQIQIYLKNVGRGTDILAHSKIDEILDVFGPLGRGFEIHFDQPACLVGGGLGIAPLLFLAKCLYRSSKDNSRDLVLLGGRTKEEVEPLVHDFQQFGIHVHCSTDDGSYGMKGFVTDILKSESTVDNSQVYACGPDPMLARVYQICKERNAGCQVSVETMMACGMGACLGCNIPARDGSYAHVCIDGPVFKAEDLVWNL